jgi:DNA-binding MarR family transcriptional regulator/GNAT superfamily N-acetyltransferase
MDDALSAVRAFNRFYTLFVGALDPDFLGTNLSLPEARVLFEIAQASESEEGFGAARQPVATDIQAALDMDAGYVSRVLARFQTRGWITRARVSGDGRRRSIALTSAGRAAFELLDERQRAKVEAVLARLTPSQRSDLVASLRTARNLLQQPAQWTVSLRTFRPGDMGLIAARQSILYRETYGWGSGIEVNIGEVTAAFLRDFKPDREQCWVAEIDGVLAGSIFLTDDGGGLSRLRLLYVEPFARGLGIGDTLVATCVDFARQVGYDAVWLWTHTILDSARRIYAAHGFTITDVHMHEEFGEPVQGENWRLDFAAETA